MSKKYFVVLGSIEDEPDEYRCLQADNHKEAADMMVKEFRETYRYRLEAGDDSIIFIEAVIGPSENGNPPVIMDGGNFYLDPSHIYE